MYAATAWTSADSSGGMMPFRLYRKQSRMRSPMPLRTPFFERHFGYTPATFSGKPSGWVPPFKWQLVQLKPLPA